MTDWLSVRFPDLALLTAWAVEARYPGDWPEPDAQDAREAVSQAESVLACMLADLRARGLEDREGRDGIP